MRFPRIQRVMVNRNNPVGGPAYRRRLGFSSAIRNGSKVCYVTWLGPLCVLVIIDWKGN